ncbi:MAG: hypothetical protein U0325_09555 [Polyangiales bacterium]
MSAPTLAGRVSRAVALACVAGAMLVAGVSHALSWRAAIAREDQRLRAAAQTLAAELTGAHDGAEADDEDREMVPAGVRVALWEGGRRLGGAPLDAGPPGCQAHTWRGARWRRCTVRVGARVLVAASPYAPLEASRDAGRGPRRWPWGSRRRWRRWPAGGGGAGSWACSRACAGRCRRCAPKRPTRRCSLRARAAKRSTRCARPCRRC